MLNCKNLFLIYLEFKKRNKDYFIVDNLESKKTCKKLSKTILRKSHNMYKWFKGMIVNKYHKLEVD
jgi:hypothetical protein